VPPPPELDRAGGPVGTVEIPGQVDPENARQSERHVGIGAEVEVDLEAETYDRSPGLEGMQARGIVEVSVHPRGEAVRDDRLLRETEREQEQARAHAVDVEVVLSEKLWLKDPVPDDRPCDQVREEGDEERVPEEASFCRQLPAVDVDGVRDPFERVEADPDRQHDSVQKGVDAGKSTRGDHTHEARQVSADEPGVLERTE
jgi:hypothetical protein